MFMASTTLPSTLLLAWRTLAAYKDRSPTIRFQRIPEEYRLRIRTPLLSAVNSRMMLIDKPTAPLLRISSAAH